MSTLEEIKSNYPLHFSVWENNLLDLENLLSDKKHDIEKLDPRKRTPLMLAVKLSHWDCVKALLNQKASANTETDGWSVVQEATCSGDANILTSILNIRDFQRYSKRMNHVPQILQKLLDAPDFYVEMKWEFTSWIPLMSKICPSDTYKVYKRGSNVRIDTTLIGFDNTTWQRGNRSYIFKGQNEEATMIEIDHDMKEVSIEVMKHIDVDSLDGIMPTKESVNVRLQTPVSSNNIDMEKISFERNKSGFWGWRSEKNELVNGYDCKVYSASNVEFITRTRSEHLNENQSRVKNSRTPLQHLLGFGGDDEYDQAGALGGSASASPLITVTDQSTKVEQNDDAEEMVAPTLLEYFSEQDLEGRDVGRPKKMQTKVQNFKANLWLSEEFPIKLQEQVLPILDLMSTLASPHVNKLRDFITMQLPSGFPVRIEIPLFHVVNAVITFGNVFALETPVELVTNIKEEDGERLTCVIDDQIFEVPPNYVKRGSEYRRQIGFENEDELLQYAIQKSLIDAGSENDEVDIWEALKAQRPSTPSTYISDEDAQLQRALQASLFESSSYFDQPTLPRNYDYDLDDDISLALRMSEEEQRKNKLDQEKDDELFQQILLLSMQEK